MFIYLGRVVSEGGRFCHDVIDNKFPTVGLMTSIAYRAFRSWWPGYVLIQTAMGIGGALLLVRSAGRHFGDAAKLPAMLFALVYFNLYIAVYGGFQLETMQCFFAILAAGAAMEALSDKPCTRDAFVVGLAAGCAAMLKPTGGAVLAAFAIAAAIELASVAAETAASRRCGGVCPRNSCRRHVRVPHRHRHAAGYARPLPPDRAIRRRDAV